MRVVDEEVESLGPQRTHHELLDQACGSLEKLGEVGLLPPGQVDALLGRVGDREPIDVLARRAEARLPFGFFFGHVLDGAPIDLDVQVVAGVEYALFDYVKDDRKMN